jgi:hypothetical protein
VVEKRDVRRGPGHGLWWASPAGSLLLVVPVSLWLAASTTDMSFRLLYRSPKVLTDDHVLLFAGGAAVLLLGALLAQAARPRSWPGRWPDLGQDQVALLARAADVCFWLTVVGYTSFAMAGAGRGVRLADLRAVLTSQSNYGGELKDAFAPVTGVTTLTQMGVAYVVLAGLLLICGHRRGVVRRLAVILVLALLRSFFLTERLALLEVLVPAILLLAVASHRRGDLRPALAPVLGLPLLVVVFGVFEYSRSWTYFRSRTSASYPEFVIDRLAGYYATAYNNGAAQLVDGGWEGRLPYASLEAVWTAPVVAQLELYERLAGQDAVAAYTTVLRRLANPEFNNPCGVCTPFVDFGVLGGMLFLLLAGVLAGLCWTGFRDGEPFGLLLYPIVFTGLLELPRYLYWTQGRLVPPGLALVTVAFLLRRGHPAARAERPRSLAAG